MEQPAAQDPLIGAQVGNYEVKTKLGEGGMGSVYLAEHPLIGKKVALKVLHAEFASNEDVVSRFFNEAKAVNDIQHPNIVDIIDYGVIPAIDGRTSMVYFIMEFLGGNSLSHVVRDQAPLAPERALKICLQIADALGASHRNQIVHRDLKPDNVILINRGREPDFVKVLDFGIAKLTGDQKGSRRTRTGIVMGTPAYMSPEQCEGRGEVDHRTDIYALGILLYECLTGRVPFQGEGYGEVLVQHLTQSPQKPSTIRGVIPPHVEVVCLKALEKQVDSRYPNMDEFMKALADPVGYVEGSGGLVGFVSQSLGAPVPAAQAPFTPQISTPSPYQVAPLTPPPGQMYTPAPGQYQSPPTGMQQPGHYGTPPPGTMQGPMPGQTYAPYQQSGGNNNKLLIIVLAALVVVGGVIGALLVLKSGDSSPSANNSAQLSAAGTDNQVPTQEEMEKTDTEKQAAPVEVGATEVTIEIETMPNNGATVFVGEGAESIGKTPFSKKFPKSDSPIVLRFEQEGFVTRTKALNLDKNRIMEITMHVVPAEPVAEDNPKADTTKRRKDRPRKDTTTRKKPPPKKDTISDDDFGLKETPTKKKKRRKKKKKNSDLMDFE